MTPGVDADVPDPADAPDVVVVGDVMVDVLVEVQDARVHGSDTASRVSTAPGGSAANQAVWLARAGARVALAAAVGADPLGAAARDALEAEGVDVASVVEASGWTGTVVALVEPDGERTMLTDRGANRELTPAAASAAVDRLTGAGHVQVSGYVLLDEATRATGVEALAAAARHGATRSVDASSTAPLLAAGPERFLALAEGAEWCFCNLAEGRLLTGERAPADVLRALGARFPEVVVTLGDEGALALGVDGEVHRAAAPGPVADTVGAGDALTASYLAARLVGSSVEDALASGGAAARRAVATRGARGWSGYSRT